MTFHKLFSAALLGLVLAANGASAHGQNIGACDPAQAKFGGEGGNPFVAASPGSLQLRSGSFVDNLILNGAHHGGNGGSPSGVLNLKPEEYINRIVVRHGSFVDRLELHTNFGRSINGGGNGGSPSTLNNIRVLTLGGRSGAYLDQLEVTYCRNYR